MPTTRVLSPQDPDVKMLIGKPPLLKTEDPKAYDALLARSFDAFKPTNIIEAVYILDFVNLTWEIFRGRRIKADLVTSSRKPALLKLLDSILEQRDFKEPSERLVEAERLVDSLGWRAGCGTLKLRPTSPGLPRCFQTPILTPTISSTPSSRPKRTWTCFG